MIQLYIVRHTPVLISKNKCYGQTDVPLADSFLHDAQQLKQQLPDDFDIVFCSPLHRCTLLSEALGINKKNVIIDNALMELNFGDWENKEWNSLDPTVLNEWMSDFVYIRPNNGENLADLFKRTSSFFESLRDNLNPNSSTKYKKILIITHAGVIRCLWSYFLAIPLNNLFKLSVGYGEVLIAQLGKTAEYDTIQRKQ